MNCRHSRSGYVCSRFPVFHWLGLLVLGLATLATTAEATQPAWWTARGAVNGTPNDWAAVNQGQLKHFTLKAVEEMNAQLPGGAGSDLNNLVSSWQQEYVNGGYSANNPKPEDFTAMTAGQLKHIANKIWARLVAVTYVTSPPSWLTVQSTDNELANLGQLKTVFNFDLQYSGDIDSMPDWWETYYFGDLDETDGGNWDGDAYTNGQEFAQGSDPIDYYNSEHPTLAVVPAIEITRGGVQGSAFGEFLPSPLGVRVTDSANPGQGLANAPVVFQVTAGNGELTTVQSELATGYTQLTMRTDEEGYISRDESLAPEYVYYRQGDELAASTIRASAASAYVDFQAESYGLLAHWMLDETSGTTASDASGRNQHAQLVGTPAWDDTVGLDGGSLRLVEGTDGFQAVNAQGQILSFSGQPFGLSLWFRAEDFDFSVDTELPIATNAPSGSTGFRLALRIASETAASLVLYRGSDVTPLLISQAAIQPGSWTLVTLRADSQETKLQINGIEDLTSSTPLTPNANPLAIGIAAQAEIGLRGWIDDVRIYGSTTQASLPLLDNDLFGQADRDQDDLFDGWEADNFGGLDVNPGGGGDGPDLDPFDPDAGGTPPGPPTNLHIVVADPTEHPDQIHLYWDAPAGYSNLTYRVEASGSGREFSGNTVVTTTDSFHRVPSNTNYRFRVRAIGSNGKPSDPSNETGYFFSSPPILMVRSASATLDKYGELENPGYQSNPPRWYLTKTNTRTGSEDSYDAFGYFEDTAGWSKNTVTSHSRPLEEPFTTVSTDNGGASLEGEGRDDGTLVLKETASGILIDGSFFGTRTLMAGGESSTESWGGDLGSEPSWDSIVTSATEISMQYNLDDESPIGEYGIHVTDSVSIVLSDEYTTDDLIADVRSIIDLEEAEFSAGSGSGLASASLGADDDDHAHSRYSETHSEFYFELEHPGIADEQWLILFDPADPNEETSVVSHFTWTTSHGDKSPRRFVRPTRDEDGTYYLLKAPAVQGIDPHTQIPMDAEQKGIAGGTFIQNVGSGQASFYIVPSSMSGVTYTLTWDSTAFRVFDSEDNQISSGYQIPPEGSYSFWIEPLSWNVTTDKAIAINITATHEDLGDVGQDTIIYRQVAPEPPSPTGESVTLPLDESAGARYRKIALNGRPLPDEKPQQEEESDQQREETFVDALTLGLRHSVTDAFIPVPGSTIALSVRRSTSPEIWNDRHGLRPHERLDRPFGSCWSSNLSSSIQFSLTRGDKDDEPDYAYVTDEEGAVYRFAIVYGSTTFYPETGYDGTRTFVPMPTGRHEQNTYLTSLTEQGNGTYVFTKKFGTTLIFEDLSFEQLVRADRLKDSPVRTLHRWARLTSVTDRLDNKVIYEYEGEGEGGAPAPITLTPKRIYCEESPDVAVYIRQDEGGRITEVWDGNGNRTGYLYAFDSVNNIHTLTDVQHPGSGVTHYGYDVVTEQDMTPRVPTDPRVPKYHCDVDSIQDPNGNTYDIIYSFDHTKQDFLSDDNIPFRGYYTKTGLPRWVSEARLPYDAPDPQPIVTFENNSLVQIGRDDSSAVYWDGYRATAVTDAEGHRREYRFDDVFVHRMDTFRTLYGNPPKFDDPITVYYRRMTIDYGASGTEVYQFDPLAGMALTSATDLSGNTTTFAYGDAFSAGSTFQQIFPSAQFYGFHSDPTKQTNALGHFRTFVYDATTRIMSSITDEELRTISYCVDPLGRRTSETIPAVGTSAAQVTAFAYENTAFPGLMTRRTVQGDTNTPTLVTEFEYDAYGRLTKEIVDPATLALTTEHTHDLQGNRKSSTDPRGHVTEFRYDSRNRLERVLYPDGTDKVIGYDLRGNKISELDENDHETRYEYDAQNRRRRTIREMGAAPDLETENQFNKVGSVVKTIDPRGNFATMEYDELQRLVRVVHPTGGGQTTYAYGANSGGSAFDSSAFKPTKMVNPRGFITEIEYDDLYRPVLERVQIQGSQYAETIKGYDDVGNLITVQDPLGKITTTDYDAANRPIKVTYHDTTFIQSYFGASGLLYQTRDELNRLTNQVYDGAGRLTEVKAPMLTGGQRAITTTEYDNAGNVTATINPRGKRWDFEYNSRNRKTDEYAPSVTNAEADPPVSARPRTTFFYDGVGNVTKVVDPRGQATVTRYDTANRPVLIISPQVLIPGSPNDVAVYPAIQSTYDANGNVLETRKGTASDQTETATFTSVRREVVNVYDALNRLESTTQDPDGLAIDVSYTYDQVGNRLSVIDGLGQKTSFEYDGLNRNTVMTDPLGRRTRFEYDGVNKTKRIDAKGQITDYDYDDRHRIETVAYSGPGVTASSRVYSYDDVGNLETVTESDTRLNVSYQYDEMNRVRFETSAGIQHEYQYDLAGNRTATIYGGTGITITSTYDDLNRLETMTEGTRVTEYGYDLNGNVVEKILPNGDTVHQEHDALNRLALCEAEDASEQAIYGYSIRYDLFGNVAKIIEDNTGGIPDRVVTNQYDGANRLHIEEIAPTGGTTVTTTYEYDDAHNRTSKAVDVGPGAGTWAYTYNSLNQLTTLEKAGDSTATAWYTYDLNGNRSRKSVTNSATLHQYDVENRLTKVRPHSGTSPIYVYGYDYRTRRVVRDESAASDVLSLVSFSGGTSVQERDGAATTPTVEYIRGSDYGGGVGGILYTLRSSTPSFTHYNSRGDVVAKTDGSGTLTYQAAYEAFGTRTAQSGSTLDRQKANTKDEDPTGLLNEHYRYRDLETGTFITRDPLGFVDGPNLYAYVTQNPWSAFDPQGLATLMLDSSENEPPRPLVKKEAGALQKLGTELDRLTGGPQYRALLDARTRLAASTMAALDEAIPGARSAAEFFEWGLGLPGVTPLGTVRVGGLGSLSQKTQSVLSKVSVEAEAGFMSTSTGSIKTYGPRQAAGNYAENYSTINWSGTSKGIATPHGVAVQADTAAAQAALGEVQSGAEVPPDWRRARAQSKNQRLQICPSQRRTTTRSSAGRR